MKKSLILISSALLLIAGCAKEQLVDPAVQNGYDGPVTIVGATYEQFATEGETKASFNENGKFGWETAESAKFEITNGWYESTAQDISADKSKCSFQIVGDLSTDMVAVLPADINPARYDAQSTNDGLKVTIPASRTWVKDQSYATMLGFGANNGGNTSYSFSHLGGLAKIKVNGVPANATKFVFKTKGFKISGEFEAGKINTNGGQTISTAAASSAATSVDDFTEDEETYTLTFASNDISSNGGVMEFNVPLPCGTYSNGFAFCFKDNGGTVIYRFVGSSPQTVERTDRLCLPTINIVGGGGENLPTKSVQNIPAGYKGDFLLAEAENVLLKIAPEANVNDINIKYNSGQKPSNLEINIVDGETAGTFAGTISGILPDTHVDFTKGTIANVSMTTSTSTFEIIYPATISTKLTVTGGNVKIKGAEVKAIEVAQNAVASEETKAPVQISMEKYTPTGESEQTPKVTEKIEANADVVVAPAKNVTVKVEAAANVQVANGGEGKVTDNGGSEIKTKAVAKIGEAEYITLADAIAAVKNDETISIIENKISATAIPTGSKKFTIDLGNKEVTVDGPAVGSSQTMNQAFQINRGNTITIKNGTIKCENSNNIFRFVIQNYADLTLEDVTVDGTNLKKEGRTDAYTVSGNSGNIKFTGNTTVKASTVSGVDAYAIDLYDYTKNGYTQPAAGVWESDGSIIGAITLGGGSLTVSKELKLTKPMKAYKGDNGTVNLTVNANIIPGDNFDGDALVIVNRGGDLTISGSGKVSNNKNAGIYCAVKMTEAADVASDSEENRAKLTVDESVTLEGYQAGISGNGNAGRGHTDVTINGSVLVKGCATDKDECCGIYQPQNGTLTINGGTIEGLVGVYVKSGSVTTAVNGGTIKGTGAKNDYVANGGGFKETGDAIVFDNCDYPGGAPNATINGGTFISTNGQAVASYAKTGLNPISPVINGGTFSDLSGVKYIADNKTYTLGANVTNAAGMSLDTKKKFTVDFGGHTYTVNKPGAGSTNTQTQAFQLIAGQNITFKNGTIKAADANLNATSEGDVKPIKRFIQNYANLTLTNMTFDGTNINGENSVVEFCNGNVTIDGTTNFTAKSGVASINVDSWKGSYPNGTAVTINTTGNVGKIHCYTEGTGSMTTKSSLTIKNGKNITIDDVSNGEVTISVEGGEIVGLPVGALKGEFSVSDTKKVHFSKGNLTYNVSTETWAFYEHQYDCATGYDANLISLFTWGYNKNTSIAPAGEEYVTGYTSVPEDLDDTEAWESFSASEDWGSQIGDGKTWRTLTAAEWQYLFNTREASTVSGTHNARYAKATVGSKSGIILLPDNYEHPSGVAELTNINTSDAGYTANSYDVTTWAAMEDAGAVFLPAADYREGDEVYYGNTFGSYWSSTACRAEYAYCVEFDSTNSNVDPENNYLDPEYVDERAYGCSVRLVTESN